MVLFQKADYIQWRLKNQCWEWRSSNLLPLGAKGFPKYAIPILQYKYRNICQAIVILHWQYSNISRIHFSDILYCYCDIAPDNISIEPLVAITVPSGSIVSVRYLHWQITILHFADFVLTIAFPSRELTYICCSRSINNKNCKTTFISSQNDDNADDDYDDNAEADVADADKMMTHPVPEAPYSWVNENWDFLAENYVFLEYFLTRNM